MEEDLIRKKALDIIEFMGLGTQSQELAKNLPHGHQRVLGICVALAATPTLLLLDEPLTGMNPTETLHTVALIRQLREEGLDIAMAYTLDEAKAAFLKTYRERA